MSEARFKPAISATSGHTFASDRKATWTGIKTIYIAD
jgi:hypothetical protein